MRSSLPAGSLRLVLVLAAGAVALSACFPPAPPSSEPICPNPWRGYVIASDHNYAGIGAYTGSNRFMCKPTPSQGIRAQLQHLRNYADPASTPYNLGYPFEPRPLYTEANFGTFPYHGAAPRWWDLGGKWAPNPAYGTAGVLRIYNEMRAGSGLAAVPLDITIMGPSELTAQQMAARVCAVGRCATWKPEISPTAMAQLYLDEGNAVGVRGDIAFCQSILETGWFSWPDSPSAASLTPSATAEVDPVTDWYFELKAATARD